MCFGGRVGLWHRAVKHKHVRQHTTRANTAAGECVGARGAEAHPAGGDVAEDMRRERKGVRFKRGEEQFAEGEWGKVASKELQEEGVEDARGVWKCEKAISDREWVCRGNVRVVGRVVSTASEMRAICVLPLVPFVSASGS